MRVLASTFGQRTAKDTYYGEQKCITTTATTTVACTITAPPLQYCLHHCAATAPLPYYITTTVLIRGGECCGNEDIVFVKRRGRLSGLRAQQWLTGLWTSEVVA